MRAIRELSGQGLHWSSISPWQRRFALHAAGELVARLRWEKVFGSLAVAETSDATWTFKRCGFLRPAVSVRVSGAESDLARLEMGWGGRGVLHGPEGRAYGWVKTSFWRSSWSFIDASERPVVLFEPEFLKRAASVRLETGAIESPDLALLVCLGWYLMVLMADDAGAVVAAAAS
ncbi:MAG TPA: hypothetical protein VFV19_07365 [Candidatus Polarisedimenticolaceae bacterium]|nr:hypothetical protein [Candidatus Polarisedimenticolaceae bacterium]